MPHRKPFNPETNGTMEFDDAPALVEHLDGDCQKVVTGD
jgi:hypothetical protein